MGCTLPCAFCCPWNLGHTQHNVVTRRWQFWYSVLEPSCLWPAFDYLKLAVVRRGVTGTDVTRQRGCLKLLCAPSSGALEQLLQLTRPWAAWCLLVLLPLSLLAVDSHCFLLKFNSVLHWKDKGANLLLLLALSCTEGWMMIHCLCCYRIQLSREESTKEEKSITQICQAAWE